MNPTEAPPTWLVIGPAQYFPGCVFGRRQPSLLARLGQVKKTFTWPLDTSWATVRTAWCRSLEPHSGSDTLLNVPGDWSALLQWLGQRTVELLQHANLPAFDPPQMLTATAADTTTAGKSSLLLPVPLGRPINTQLAWQAVVQAVDQSAAGHSVAAITLGLKQAMSTLKKSAPSAGNTPRFLRAAYQLGIPVTPVGLEVFQYGQGRYAQWFDSTFTLDTSNISTRLSRDKQSTAQRLSQAGLPVPKHVLANDVETALHAAAALGYPVVVKPANLDGGRGVSAGLQSPQEVRQAFTNARQLSNRILVEQHVQGRDYRLTVMDGQLLWAIERQPAEVVGDGVQTVEMLIEQENAQPNRGEGPHATLKRIVLDEDALQLLERQTLKPDSVPSAGQRVLLRRNANVASGGKPVSVIHQVHPDNALLAVRAAQALRLDIAGIDLLVPDIRQPWHTTGGAICEVNAQPQLGATTGPHLYGEILRKRLGSHTRIPIAVVVGEPPHEPVSQRLLHNWEVAGLCTGHVGRGGATLRGATLQHARAGSMACGHVLLTHPQVDAIVFSIHDTQTLHTGLPFDRYDALVLAGGHLQGAGPMQLNHLFAVLSPACLGQLMLLEESDLKWQSPPGTSAPQVHVLTLDAVCEALSPPPHTTAGVDVSAV